jgi:hypothetical protein
MNPDQNFVVESRLVDAQPREPAACFLRRGALPILISPFIKKSMLFRYGLLIISINLSFLNIIFGVFFYLVKTLAFGFFRRGSLNEERDEENTIQQNFFR